MIYGQSTRLEGVDFNNPSLPVLRNFQALIAAHANCIGAWRMDGADPLYLDANGGIVAFANWKTGGLPLVLAGGQPATLVDNVLSGGKIARFGAAPSGEAVEYRLNGYAWDLAKSYTIVAVVKPDNYNAVMNVCGDILANDMTKTAGIFTRKNNTTPAVAMFEANNTLYVNVVNENVLLPVLARHDATAKQNYLTGLGIGSNTGASAGAAAAGTVVFKLSDQALYPFVGLLDFVALFDINTAADAALQTTLSEYIAMRARSV